MRLPEFRDLSGAENVAGKRLGGQRGGCGLRGPNIHEIENLQRQGPVGFGSAGDYVRGAGPGVPGGSSTARALLLAVTHGASMLSGPSHGVRTGIVQITDDFCRFWRTYALT